MFTSFYESMGICNFFMHAYLQPWFSHIYSHVFIYAWSKFSSTKYGLCQIALPLLRRFLPFALMLYLSFTHLVHPHEVFNWLIESLPNSLRQVMNGGIECSVWDQEHVYHLDWAMKWNHYIYPSSHFLLSFPSPIQIFFFLSGPIVSFFLKNRCKDCFWYIVG